MRVHAELGSGFLEAVYQEALEKEFIKSKIPFERHRKLSLVYDGEKLRNIMSLTFIVILQSLWN